MAEPTQKDSEPKVTANPSQATAETLGASLNGTQGSGTTKVLPKTVTITEEQWTTVLQEIANLKRGNTPLKPTRITTHTAMLRFCNDRPVVKYDNFQEILENGKRTGYIDLTLSDGEVITVPYLEFLNEGNAEKVSITSQKATESVKSYGSVRAMNPDPLNQKTWNGGMIELDVTSVTYQAEVEVLEGPRKGQKFSVPTSALNA